jgi:Toprim domain
MAAIDRVLDRLDGVKRSGDGWEARCPAHDDRHASLSVAVGDDGRVLLNCHAGDGCSWQSIVDTLGLSPNDLFETSGDRRIVATYDYLDEDGALIFQVVRFDPKQFMQRRPNGTGGWIWKTAKTRRVLYRLPQVIAGVKAGDTIYICEGEKDVHALEQAGVVATCNPMGAGKWRQQYGKPLRGADVVIVEDRDEEGRKHADAVAASLEEIANSVRRVEPAVGKDVSDHFAAGRSVQDLVPGPERPEYRNGSREPASLSGKPFQPADPESPGIAPELALEPDILKRLREDLPRAGLAGEQQLAQLVYLALTSRLLPWAKPTERPVSVIPKGSTSTGKSHATKTTLRFFPPNAYIDLGSMSRRYLFYTEDELAHRFVYVPEWGSIADDDELVAILRTLLSEGQIVHGTVEGDGKRTARRIEKQGPTGLLMTTTVAAVDPEMETRCLSVMTDDSTAQTVNVFKTLAALEDELDSPVDFAAWHRLQDWLAAHGETRVIVPYIGALAELMPATATRLRRDFVTLVCLVRAHAILHRATRTEDEHGRLVATIAQDYKPVRALVAALIAEGVGAGVSTAMRETVDAVAALIADGVPHVSPAKLIGQLDVGQSATYDRIRRALQRGYLVDEATKDDRHKKLVIGTPLPGASEFLPTPEQLEAQFQSIPDQPHGNAFASTMRDREGDSGIPAIPADPPDEHDDTAAHFAREAADWLNLDLSDEQLNQATAAIAVGADALETVRDAYGGVDEPPF